MNPLAILSIIQLGASLIGGFRAQQAAAEQQRLMENAMNRYGQTMEAALNTAAGLANRDITSILAPYYSALQGRGLAALSSEAGAGGLTGGGLESAARLGFRNEISAQLAKDLLNFDAQRGLPLLQAQMQAASGFMDAAKLRGDMSWKFTELGSPNLSWLPALLQANPKFFGLGDNTPTNPPNRYLDPSNPYWV